MSDWVISGHAQEQMEERGVARDQLDKLLRWPQVSIPDPMGKPNCRYYSGGGVLAVVDEGAHEVITVGIIGASNRDWESFLPPPAIEESPQPAAPLRRPRRRRPKDKGLPVARGNVLDGVHPGIAADVRSYLAANGLDFRAVTVLGPTQVEIDPSYAAERRSA